MSPNLEKKTELVNMKENLIFRGNHGAHEGCPCVGEICTEGCHQVRCTCQGIAELRSTDHDLDLLGGTGALRQRGWHVEKCGKPHQGCSHLQVGSGIATYHKFLFCTNFKEFCPQASMKDVAVNTVVVTEIACWFFIGECIGKYLISE